MENYIRILDGVEVHESNWNEISTQIVNGGKSIWYFFKNLVMGLFAYSEIDERIRESRAKCLQYQYPISSMYR